MKTVLLLLLSACVSFAQVPGFGIANLTSHYGLVGFWPLTEGSGTMAKDYAGYGNTGALTNSVAWTAGPAGMAVYVTNTADVLAACTNYIYVASPTVDLQVQSNQFSITVWMKLTTLPLSNTKCTLFGYGSAGQLSGFFFAYANTSGNYQFDLIKCLIADQLITCILRTNTWYHIAAVQNQSLGSDTTWSLYTNGIPAGNSSVQSSTYVSPAGGQIWMGGGNTYSACRNLNGALASVKLYNRALSATEIRAMVYTNASGAWPLSL
jgi:hypothetical protein